MTKIEFANHGVPGAPGSLVAEIWAETEIDHGRRELAVFCFGTNDGVLDLPHDVSLSMLERVLDRAEDLGVPAFVIGPPPSGDGGEIDGAIAELSSLMGHLTAMRAVPFMATFDALGPGSTWQEEAGAGDGSHPGAGGYAELAELLRTGGLTEWLLAMASR